MSSFCSAHDLDGQATFPARALRGCAPLALVALLPRRSHSHLALQLASSRPTISTPRLNSCTRAGTARHCRRRPRLSRLALASLPAGACCHLHSPTYLAAVATPTFGPDWSSHAIARSGAGVPNRLASAATNGTRAPAPPRPATPWPGYRRPAPLGWCRRRARRGPDSDAPVEMDRGARSAPAPGGPVGPSAAHLPAPVDQHHLRAAGAGNAEQKSAPRSSAAL